MLVQIAACAEILYAGKKHSAKRKTRLLQFLKNILSTDSNLIQIMKLGGCVYIISNHSHSVLYIGVTSDLLARINEHREKKYPDSFTAKYNCNKLLYYEGFLRIEEAIAREKQLKKWKREWKERLITSMNPAWRDLFDSL